MDEALRTRLGVTYMTALKAAHECAYVSIHVAEDVWDALVIEVVKSGITSEEKVALCWGYPLVQERAWEPGTIKVRTETIIW